MIAPDAIHRAGARIQRDAARLPGRALHTSSKCELRRKGGAGAPILHKLDAPEEAAAANVAHGGEMDEGVAQQGVQRGAEGGAAGDEGVAGDDLLDREGGGARDGVGLVSVAVVEGRGAVADGGDDAIVDEHGGDGRVSATETFADGDDVGDYVFLLKGKVGAGAAGAAHDFVEV